MNNHRCLLIAALLLAMLPWTTAAAQLTNLQRKPPVHFGGYHYWLYLPDGYGEPEETVSPAAPHSGGDGRGLDEAGQDGGTQDGDGIHGQSSRWPLIIFLHGASLCGNNLNRVLSYGTLDAIGMGREVPAVVIAPQNPGGAWNPRKLNNLLDWAFRHCDIDTTRVYVLGMSLGGYGTLDFAGTYPDRIAAAMALCGGCTLSDQSGLLRLPLWIMHGTADRAVPLSQSTAVVNKMSIAGPIDRLRSDWLPGASHSALARIFYLAETYDWLFAHQLDDPGRPVNRDIVINQSMMAGAYRDLPSRGRQWSRQAAPAHHKGRHAGRHAAKHKHGHAAKGVRHGKHGRHAAKSARKAKRSRR